MNLKEKVAMVIDYGVGVSLALKLAESFKKVYYHCPWQSMLPNNNKKSIGTGIEAFGVYRADYWKEHKDEVDLFVFIETYCWDDVEDLRKQGKRVFGPGKAEELENNRRFSRKMQKNLGLPTQETKFVMGIDNLINELKKKAECYVKLDEIRGVMETFYAYDFEDCEDYLAQIKASLGTTGNKTEFVLEKKVEGMESGYDGFVIDGKYPNYGLIGIERKSSGYIGMVIPYNSFPKPIKDVTDKFSNYFKAVKTRSFLSNEIIIDKDRRGFLIDWTPRAPMPCGTACQLELWSNLAEFMYEAAGGNLIDLIPKYKFCAGVCLDSEQTDENWMNVRLDPKIRQFIKINGLAMSDSGKYKVAPETTDDVTVLGFGGTMKEAVGMVKKNIEKVHAHQLDNNAGGLDRIMESFKENGKYGLPEFK